jgi:soluble lytic murein transglycosylase
MLNLGMVRKLLFVATGVVVITGSFLFHQSYTKMDVRLATISQYVQEQETIATIEVERQTGLRKINDIISRYNLAMDEKNKQAIAGEIFLMSRKYKNLNVEFICATITHESARTWNPKVTSRVGAMGLMQIMPTTGAFLAAKEGILWTTAEKILFDPIMNIRLGCRYLSDLVNMYEQDGALAAYNGGPKRAELWLASNKNKNILFAETRDYVPAVLKLYDEYRAQESL